MARRGGARRTGLEHPAVRTQQRPPVKTSMRTLASRTHGAAAAPLHHRPGLWQARLSPGPSGRSIFRDCPITRRAEVRTDGTPQLPARSNLVTFRAIQPIGDLSAAEPMFTSGLFATISAQTGGFAGCQHRVTPLRIRKVRILRSLRVTAKLYACLLTARLRDRWGAYGRLRADRVIVHQFKCRMAFVLSQRESRPGEGED